MGFLDIFRKKEDKDSHLQDLRELILEYKHIIGRRDYEIQELKRDKALLEAQIKEILVNASKDIEKPKEEATKPLTPLEEKIFNSYSKHKDIEKVARDLKLTPGSVKVYLSKIKKKNYKL